MLELTQKNTKSTRYSVRILSTVVPSILLAVFLILNITIFPLDAATRTTMNSSFTPSTPIKHLVIIFQENVSFDHYFATYPKATNPAGEPRFIAKPGTPTINGLNDTLLHNNTNSINPFRLDRSESITCDMKHDYTNEQKAYNGGLLNKFVEFTGSSHPGCHPTQVMGYFDGNTVTALWNYAQHYSLNDNYFGTTFGPSTPSHINLISGQTHGAVPANMKNPNKFDVTINGTLIGNIDPAYDVCSRNYGKHNATLSMEGRNVGNLLNSKDVTWGWFSAGFRLDNSLDPILGCDSRQSHASAGGVPNKDYYPDVEPFQYYNSTANPNHLPPTSIAMIGHTDQANHQYDLTDFWAASKAGNMPSVSFLKAATFEDGHPEISDPLAEQAFLVNTVNTLERLPEWNSTAVIITWDDSDGWYDHLMPPIVSQSNDPTNDALLGPQGLCGMAAKFAFQDRCGYGPRIPFLVISPYAKTNFVDHTLTDQTSILRFIEDNWKLGRINNQSFDAKAGSVMNMFDFSNSSSHHTGDQPLLDPTTGLQNATGVR